MPLSRVLVTGSTGLVGNALVPALLATGTPVRATARRKPSAQWAAHPACEFMAQDVCDAPGALVAGVESVVHLAARVHVMRERAADPLAENRRINTDATLHLARAAIAAGVKHFVYVSTIKVNGEETGAQPFSETDPPHPQDAYAISKHEAELGLAALVTGSAMQLTILRPPLVYGRGVKGNFASLVRAVQIGIPLPLGAVANRRSLVFAGNLAHAIVAVLARPAPGARTFLISDGEDLSTPELIRAIAVAVGRPPRLLAVPPVLLRLAGRILDRSAAVERLLGSLAVDSSKIRRELDWKPPHTLCEGLERSIGRQTA